MTINARFDALKQEHFWSLGATLQLNAIFVLLRLKLDQSQRTSYLGLNQAESIVAVSSILLQAWYLTLTPCQVLSIVHDCSGWSCILVTDLVRIPFNFFLNTGTLSDTTRPVVFFGVST